MIVLQVPIVSQLTNITTDKLPSENKWDDCVAAAVLMVVMYLKGVKTLEGIYTPDNFKDKSAGQGYVGFTAAWQYVPLSASLGVRLFYQGGDPVALIKQIKENLQNNLPSIGTEPSPYTSTPGVSHVIVFYGDDGTNFMAIDPFYGTTIKKSYAQWEALLQFNQIWVGELSKAPAPALIQPTEDDLHVWNLLSGLLGRVPLVPEHGVPQSWLRAKHQKHVELGPPLENEVDTGLDVRQTFLMGRAVYNKKSGQTTWFTSSGPVVF